MTELEAANKALALLGVAPVASLSQDTQAARTARALLTPALEATLTEYPWAFALRMTALAPSSAAPPPGWLFAYEPPPGALSFVQAYGEQLKKLAYVCLNGKIFSSEPIANAEYTVYVPLDKWPRMAAEAMACRLASDAAAALTGSGQIAASMLEKYGLLCKWAHLESVNAEHAPAAPASRYIDARQGG